MESATPARGSPIRSMRRGTAVIASRVTSQVRLDPLFSTARTKTCGSWSTPLARKQASGTVTSYLAAFQQGLRDLGYLEGKNLLIDRRYAAGQLACSALTDMSRARARRPP